MTPQKKKKINNVGRGPLVGAGVAEPKKHPPPPPQLLAAIKLFTYFFDKFNKPLT